MPWVKVDDQFQDHPKFLDVSLAAVGLWVAGLAYCSRYLTDGKMSSSAVRRLGGTKKLCDELQAVGLWTTTTDGGWQIHDYLQYNPSSDQVRDLREKRAEAGKRGGEARGRQKQTEANVKQIAKHVADPRLSPRPVPSPFTEVTTLRDTSRPSSTGDDDDQIASEALTAVGRRRHTRTLAANRVTDNPAQHERACIANAHAEYGDQARTWRQAHPDGTIDDLVAHLDPEPPPPAQPILPPLHIADNGDGPLDADTRAGLTQSIRATRNQLGGTP